MNRNHRFLDILTRLRGLSLSQWRWFFVAVWKLLYVSVMVNILGFHWVKKRIGNELPLKNACKAEYLKIAEKMHESIRLAARVIPFKTECLPKSIVLAEMLQEKNIPAIVKLGVQRSKCDLLSHAWVSICDNNVAELDDIQKKFIEIKF